MSKARLQTVKPSIAMARQTKANTVQATKRPTGNSLYALMRSFEMHNPRLCAECKRRGLVGYGDELDHVIPLHLGGSNSHQNLEWLCREHHQEKSANEAKQRGGGWL